MPDLLGIPLIISAVFACFFACHAAAYYWWHSQSLAGATRKVKTRIYAWGSATLALSMGAFCAFSAGILRLFELQLSAGAAAGLVTGIVLTPALVLRFLKPKGEKLGQTAKRLAEKASNRGEEIDQLWGEIYDLRSKLRKKSGELKDVNAELAKLRRALGRKESPAAPSSAQEKTLPETQPPILLRGGKVAGKGRPPTLVEKLLELKTSGWKFAKFRVKGKEYVKVRRTTVRGKREEHSLGRLYDEMKKALNDAGISLG